jgi:hypothetical protein
MTRLVTDTAAASELGVPLATFRHLVNCGRLPRPLPELDLYDMKAIHAALDRMSGITSPSNALERWREARQNAR